MMNILALLQCIQPEITKTNLKHLSRIVEAMLSISGRVTMLSLSRWAGKGGSYRTIQRFFNTPIAWSKLHKAIFERHLYDPEKEYFLVGDECVVTKSGHKTYGLDIFFSGLLSRVTKSIAIFTLSLVDVNERRAYPMRVKQMVRSQAEKEAAKAKKKEKQAKKALTKGRKQAGRPKGSKNRDKTKVTLTAELQRIQKMIQKQLASLPTGIQVKQLALDGHFGNNNALQMVRQCGLHLISKLRHDAALHFLYDGLQKKKGPRKKYGDKIDYRHIPQKYLVNTHIEGDIKTCIYQAEMLHRDFVQSLNVVFITKTNLKTGAVANVNLFSSDLSLSYEKIIDYYRLRFQIEFNFRDAKQVWGLEDFMNVNQVPLTNALNLSLFMVTVSQVLLQQFRQTRPESGVLDLKAYFRAAKYVDETIKLLPEKPEPILLNQIFAHVASLGCIHSVNVQCSSP
jgi:putative transposase